MFMNLRSKLIADLMNFETDHIVLHIKNLTLNLNGTCRRRSYSAVSGGHAIDFVLLTDCTQPSTVTACLVVLGQKRVQTCIFLFQKFTLLFYLRLHHGQ